jgi:hypothetical protein
VSTRTVNSCDLTFLGLINVYRTAIAALETDSLKKHTQKDTQIHKQNPGKCAEKDITFAKRDVNFRNQSNHLRSS